MRTRTKQIMSFHLQRWEIVGTQAIHQDHWSFYLYLGQCHLLYNWHSLQTVILRRNRETTRWPIPRKPSRCRERRGSAERGPGMVQWWERSPPTNVTRVRSPDPASFVDWVCCWFSSLLRGFFSRFSGFPPSSKSNISKFQFDREFEGHGFISWKTVVCHPRYTKLILFNLVVIWRSRLVANLPLKNHRPIND